MDPCTRDSTGLPDLSGETAPTWDGVHSYDFDFNCESG